MCYNALMIKKYLQDWKVIIALHWLVVVGFAGLLVYYVAKGSFSGVDGGLGLVAGVLYLLLGAGYVGVMYAIRKYVMKRPRANKVALTVYWSLLIVGVVGATLLLAYDKTRSGGVVDVSQAISRCEVTDVSWTINPSRVEVRYSDADSFVFNGYVMPTLVDGYVRALETKCDTRINYTNNGNVPANRR